MEFVAAFMKENVFTQICIGILLCITLYNLGSRLFYMIRGEEIPGKSAAFRYGMNFRVLVLNSLTIIGIILGLWFSKNWLILALITLVPHAYFGTREFAVSYARGFNQEKPTKSQYLGAAIFVIIAHVFFIIGLLMVFS